jgi:hypothetical protein
MSSSSLIFSMGAISMKVNPACVSILIIATSLAIHTHVHSYLAITLALGSSELGSYRGPHIFSSGVSARRHVAVWNGAPIAALTPSLRRLRPLSWGGLNWGSYHGPHTFSKVSLPVVMRRLHPPSAEMLQSGSKILYHHVHYGRDYCHWLHRKRKLRYTPRNPPPRFLCLELLCLSAWQLHLHQLFLVSSPFIIGGRLLSQAFAPPQLGAFTTALFPSLHALERSSHVVFIKSIRDFLLYKL